MAGEWGAVVKAVSSSVLRFLPLLILRRWYPIHRCQEGVTVDALGIGPHIFVNPGISPVISGLALSVTNRLPFPVKVENFSLDLKLESTNLTNQIYDVKEEIAGGTNRPIHLADTHLTDAQAGLVKDYPADCPTLQLTGYVACRSAVGEFKKHLQLKTRAFIYRG